MRRAATLTSVSVVREEFGPTLPELLGARLGVPARTIWRVLAAAGVLVVLVLVWLAFVRGTPGQAGVVVRGPAKHALAPIQPSSRTCHAAGWPGFVGWSKYVTPSACPPACTPL